MIKNSVFIAVSFWHLHKKIKFISKIYCNDSHKLTCGFISELVFLLNGK